MKALEYLKENVLSTGIGEDLAKKALRIHAKEILDEVWDTFLIENPSMKKWIDIKKKYCGEEK